MRHYLSDWKAIIYNLAFFLNGLLIFLLVFDSRFDVPGWMFPLGRLHPVVLHFPLVALLIYGCWIIIVEKQGSTRWNADLANTLLLLGTFTATVAAFSGFILSKEDSEVSSTLMWHKYLGVGISIGSVAWYGLARYLSPWKIPAKSVAFVFIVLLLAAGHLGGNLTHGEDFLTIPSNFSEETVAEVSFEEAEVYENLIHPVLQQKCYSCHNAEKSKGGLQMHTADLLLKGGKSGMLWDTTQKDLGLLLRRVHLPLDDKKHMPPRGKVQLTEEEVVLIAEWVRAGSDFKQKVRTLSPQNPVYSYAKNTLGGNRIGNIYTFEAADAEKVKALNTNYRVVKPYAPESPALFVNFYNKTAFKSSEISDLLPIKEQIVSMDFSKMPVKDADLKIISQFTELRKLLLNFTEIQGNTLLELKKLPNLKELALSGTAVQISQIKALESFPSLTKVYLWSTALTTKEQQTLVNKKIRFETGFRSDTVIIALNPPVIENEQQIVMGSTGVKLNHQIPGTEIRYTLDGTLPDSGKALIYSQPIPITKNTTIKARAFKAGWYGSASVDKMFIKATYHIDSVRLILPPDAKYKGKGPASLTDGIKSSTETGSGNWLGYRDTNFESLFFFDKPAQVGSLTISTLCNVGGSVFPPAHVEVWGGSDEHSLKLLKIIKPLLPGKMIEGSKELLIDANFDPQQLSCLKIIARPLSKLPSWHPAKGKKAWVFLDEVIVN